MSSSGRSSFKSYVKEVNAETKKKKKLLEAFEKMYQQPTVELEKLLHPGELITGVARKVIKYNVHDGPARGLSGSLICTNFRVKFVTNDQPISNLNELNNRLLKKHDIPLSDIESLIVEYPNKRKRLYPSSKVKEGVQRLEIHCKNFRVEAFNFKLTVKFEEQGVIKAIVHHSFPSTLSLLFAFDHKPNQTKEKGPEQTNNALYRCYADWQDFIRKNDAEESWRVTSVNQNFSFSSTMPEHFVVPKIMKDNQLKSAVDQYNNERVPAWCWSSKNKCALVRSSELRADSDLAEKEKTIIDAIQAIGQNREIKTVNVTKMCPSYSQIQQSYNKLKSLCTVASIDEFYNTDTSWLASLQATRWLQSITTLLSVATDVLQLIVFKQEHVIIKEFSGVDISPVLTSLVQIMADPFCRTLTGFQLLIQREWVAAGFPFLNRLGHLHQPNKSKGNPLLNADADNATMLSPVFLLFLDCVWQLTQQYPSSFEFTSFYLVTLYDSSRMHIFDTFLFNNERDRQRVINERDRQRVINSTEVAAEVLPSVWNWDLQFDEQSQKLFINPFYRLAKTSLNTPFSVVHSPSTNSLSRGHDSLNILEPVSAFAEDLLSSSWDNIDDNEDGLQLHYNSKTGTLSSESDLSEEKKKNRFSISQKLLKSSDSASAVKPCDADPLLEFHADNEDESDVIVPRTSLAFLELWTSCYFRWMPWSQMLGGSPAASYQHHSVLYDEVYHLNNHIFDLEKQLDTVTTRTQNDSMETDSGVFFSHQSFSSEVSNDSKPYSIIANHFPFIPSKGESIRPIVGADFPYCPRSDAILSSQNRTKHVRSSSDISVPSSIGDDPVVSSYSLSDTGEERKRSASAQPPKPPEQSAKPKKKVALMPPSEHLTAPKEHVTYVSSV